MPTHGMAAKLFPRGGTLVSKSQKDKKIMKKVRKQVGKKADLFSQQSKKTIKKVGEAHKKKMKKQKKEEDDDAEPEEEIEKLPKNAICISTKLANRNAKALCFVRTIDELGMSVTYPGGATGYVKLDQVSDKVTDLMSNDEAVELEKMYKIGEAVLTSLSVKRKKSKLHLSLKPKFINANLRVDKLCKGQNLAGTVTSEEDTGFIIDLGIKESKGFISSENAEGKNLMLGKTMIFYVEEILLDGRQIVLSTESSSPLSKLSDIDSLLPGALVDFKIQQKNRQGFGGKVFDFNATMHHSQSADPCGCAANEEESTQARVIYVDHEFKRICLANSAGYMSLAEEQAADRDGEVVKGKVKITAGGGVILEFGNGELGWCPRHNLSENRVDDLLSHFPVGKEVRARIIGHMTGEQLHLLTFRESVVEAEFFRYDSFSATQIIVGKVCKVNSHGWVTLQLAPHLYGQITPNHVGNSRMSNENLETKYKLGSSHRVMVLDKSSDRVFLTAKPSVMKTKGLKRFTDLDDVSVGAISLGTIVNVHASSIIVQFFNNIKAYVPISQLSHEFIKDTKTNFEAGQVVRCRVLEVCPERENQLVGSLVLEPGKKEKKQTEKSEKTSLIGSEVTVTLDDEQPANMIMGKTSEGMKLTLSERDFSLDPLVASTFYNLVRTKKSPLENVVVETKMRDNVKGSKIQIVKAASTRGWTHRCGSKLDDMEEGKLLLGQVVKKTEFGFQLQFGGRLRGFLPRSNMVERFIPDHDQAASIGDTILAKVTQVNAEKKRFIVTTKESEMTDIPDYFSESVIFESYQTELNELMDYTGMNLRFGDAVLCKYVVKCEHERAAGGTPLVEFIGQAKGFTARMIGGSDKDGTTTTALAKFIGFSAKNELLFVKSKQRKQDKTTLILNGDFLRVYNFNGHPAISFSRPNLLCRTEQMKLNTDVNFNSKTEVNGVHFGVVERVKTSTINEPGRKEGKDWGVASDKELKEGDIHDGIVYGVSFKGVLVCLGKDTVVSVPFGKVTPYFMPKDKSAEICKKYFKKGKSVKVQIASRFKKTLQASMVGDYVDGKAEGLTISTKRKKEMEKLEKDEITTPMKAIKLDIQPTKNTSSEAVKEEPKSLLDAAEMDLDFDDTVAKEVERRSKKPQKTNEPEADSGKTLSLEEIEDNAREAEREMEKSKLPEDVSGWERAVITAPNNSEIWLRYSAFHIASGEIEKSRMVMDRALKTIHFREEDDRLNIWKARLNLEALYGDKESLQVQFNEAKKCNDERKVYHAVVGIQLDSNNYSSAIPILRDAVKKYPEDIELWSKLGRCQIEDGSPEKATVTLQRALQANKAKTHVMITQKFAKLQFEFGDLENGKTILEQMLKVHAKRADIWGVYGDLLLKFGDGEDARRVLLRGIEGCSKSRGRLHLMKRMINLEERIGDEQSAQEWRTKVENEKTKMPSGAQVKED